MQACAAVSRSSDLRLCPCLFYYPRSEMDASFGAMLRMTVDSHVHGTEGLGWSALCPKTSRGSNEARLSTSPGCF